MNHTVCSVDQHRLLDFEPPVLTAVCSYCKRVRTAAGHWCGGDGCDETDDLTHSACPSCYGVAVIALLEEIREEIAALKNPPSHKGSRLS